MRHFDDPFDLDKLTAEELALIRRFIEQTDLDQLSDDMRALVRKHWPWLLEKLPSPSFQ